MKRLTVICVMSIVFGFAAQAYGTVLVYNLFGSVQTVDALANDADTKIVLGYLLMDVNVETGDYGESALVLYGREKGDRIYVFYENVVAYYKYGYNVAVMIDTGTGSLITMTGQTRGRVNAYALRMGAPNLLSGAMSLYWSTLFDLDESLVGAGIMQATLNNQWTRTANSPSGGFSEAVNSILDYLEARHYEYLAPSQPGDGDGIPN